MAEPSSVSVKIDRLILLLLAAGALLCWLWPSFRWVQARAAWHLSVFGGRALDREPLPMLAFQEQPQTGDGSVARLARHIDFQIANTPFDAARAQALFKEHAATAGEPRVLAWIVRSQLAHFPGGGAKSPEAVKASAVLDWACALGVEKDPGNAFFIYSLAARNLLLKNPDEALKRVREANAMAGFNSYLLDANRSEAGLALSQGELPGDNPWHAIDGTHPFRELSQWLRDTARTAVKKYNQERALDFAALDFALLNLNLGERQWWDASTVRQASAAEQTCLRAMGSMSKGATGAGEWKPLEAEFLDFLDDIGERQKMNEYRDSFARLQQTGIGPWLVKTRQAQAELAPAALTLIVFLDGVFILSLAGWLILRWGSLAQQPFEPEAGRWGFIIAVVPGAAYWSIWPGGLSGTYLFLTLAVSSVAWVCVLLAIAKSSHIAWIDLVRSGLRGVLLGLLIVWLGTGIAHARATEQANVWLRQIGTVPWVEQRL